MHPVQAQTLRFARRAFFIYAANSTLSALGVALATICDSIVVGNAFGELGLAVTSVVLPVYVLFDFLSFMLGIGGSTAVSQAFGREDHAAAQSIFAQTLTLSLLASVALAALGTLFLRPLVALLGGASLGEEAVRYVGTVVAAAPAFVCAPVLSLMLSADGDPKRSTFGVVLSSAVNLVLDLVFVFGMGSGIVGAAWAMVIGQCCAVAVYLPHYFQRRYGLHLQCKRCHWQDFQLISRSGLGAASSYAWQFLYLTVFNNLLSRTTGETGLAIFNLLFNVHTMTYAVTEGISLTVPSLAGTYLGERDHLSLRCTLTLALQAAAALSAALAALVILLSPQVVALFGISAPDTISLAIHSVRIYAPAIFFSCVGSVLCACWQSLGHTRLSTLAHFCRGCLFPLAVGIPLVLVFHAQGTAAALLLGEMLGFFAILLMAKAQQRPTGAETLLLLPKHHTDPAVYEDVLDRDFHRLPEVVEAVEAFCDAHDIDPGTAYSIQLTIEELSANIIQFGFQDNRPHFIAIKVACYDEDIFVRIRDDATSYNPFQPQEGADELDLMGVELVQKRAKDFIYQRRLIFNNLLIIL